MKRKLSALEGKTEALHSDTSEVIEIYDRKEFKHLSAGFCSICSESSWDGSSLPYHELAGPGLERLCYLMLLEQGGIPRYFGKPGQKQYGIDLLVSHGGECTVYQCKNVKSFPLSEMKKALELFEKEWLGRPELPTPKQFVLCCSLPLQERKQNEKWTALERQFHERTGVSVVFWDCNYLDERLKRLPDVVAELFSDRVAERFCNMNDWNKDLFRPVVAGSGEITIDRYLNLKAAGRIYLAPQLAEDFVRKLENNGSLLIRGLPGTGKTTTGLALAESFHQGKHRIFYVNLRYDISEDALVTGIKRRLTRPTIFLLDDCHGKFDEMLDNMQNRVLSFAEMRGRGLLVFTARTTPTPEGMPRGDYSNFEESLNQNEAILELQPTPDVFRQIITLVKPHFAGLSEERLHKVFEFTGQDLFLLDQLLETISSPDDIDQLEPETLFEETLVRYFGAPTVDHPGFMNLAALAQFDLMPPVSSFRDFDLEKENEKAVKELLVTADRPARYFFLHSSAAELVFRSLAWNDGINDYPELAADYLIEFFKSRRKSDKKLAVDLSNAIWNRLKLTSDENEENRLRGRFLADDGIYALIEDTFEQLPLNLLAVCLIILRSTDAATYERYLDLAQRKIADGTVLEMAITRPLWEIGFFLQLVKRYYPPLLSSLQSQLVDRGLRSLIKLTKFQNILLLLAKLAEPDNPQWAALLDLIQDSELEEIIQRTIASGRSIGTIDLALQELKKTNPDLLDKLERKIGAKRYLYLITSAGTIFELFRAIQHSSLSMAGELIEALDTEALDTLIAKTIASGRSIGTINWTLRELKETNPDLLEQLERKIGAERHLHLITSAGTIVELFRAIQHSSLLMAGELIEALDAETLDTLIAKTIASGHSIGTIHFTLRELKNTNPDLLDKLERKIGAKRYLDLITSAGTIFELFMIIRDSSLSMAEELIEVLDVEILDTLIAKTIASGRSIGTIDLTLRELKETNPDLLEQLERKIGAKRYLHLITSAGTIFELFRAIQYSSPSMAEGLIEAFDTEILDTLIAKTIASGRSIGTIDLTLRELKNTNPVLLDKLERKIGAKRHLHLITSAGTIFELFMVIKDSSLSMAGALIEALDAEALDTLIAKTIASGRSIGTINLTLWELKKANPDLLEQLERKIGAKRWWQLICANGTMRILTQISQRMDESFKWELEQDSQALSLDDWQKLLLRGDFADLAHFVKWAASYFPELSTPTFLRRFKPTFETLIGRDGWEVLDQGQALLIKAPSFPIKPYLLSLVRDYLAPVEQGSLCFSSFDEAIHCIHLLWHVCQSRRQELTNSLLTILPEEEVWYVDEKFLRSARLLFFILANPQAPPDDARRVLAMGNSGEVASLCVEATTLDIFLYLWNLYSLWFEWEKAEENTFATFLNSEIRNIISDVLTTRFQTHADEAETDNLIALVGLLSFITGLDFSPAEKARWLSKLPSFDELLSRAEAKTFIPGFFFLFGLEYIFDRADSVPQQTWLGLLLKAEEYPEKFAASEYLHNLVCVRAGK